MLISVIGGAGGGGGGGSKSTEEGFIFSTGSAAAGAGGEGGGGDSSLGFLSSINLPNSSTRCSGVRDLRRTRGDRLRGGDLAPLLGSMGDLARLGGDLLTGDLLRGLAGDLLLRGRGGVWTSEEDLLLRPGDLLLPPGLRRRAARLGELLRFRLAAF